MRRKTVTFLGILLAPILALAIVTAAAGSDRSLSFKGKLPKTERVPLKWGRDIFIPLARPGSVAAGRPDLRLKAVFQDKERPSVIINRSILYRGSTIDGQKVVVIGKRHVILLGKHGKYRLDLYDSKGISNGN